MNNIEKSVNEIVSFIKNTEYYKKVLILRNNLEKNSNIMTLIDNIKTTQKEYVKSGFSDKKLKEKLDRLNKELEAYPIYNEYNRNLEEVNNMIDVVKDNLNDYFFDKLNII